MNVASVATWLISAGFDLIEKARELWQQSGKTPAEFDAMVDAARDARAATIAAQRADELKALGGK